MAWLCIFAVPLGLGAGAVDTALNNYVALHYKASHMSFLHCFYGVGVSLSPCLMATALEKNNDWNSGYRTMFYFQSLIAIIIFLSLPLWKKVKKQGLEKGEAAGRIVKIPEMIGNPTARASIMVFTGSCAIESVCLGWGSTFLVNTKNASPDKAAKLITLYFIGVTLGRFLSGVIADRLSPVKIILTGETITFAALIPILLAPSPFGAAIGLFLIGLGNGPVFPNMTHLTPVLFGTDVSQSYIGLQMSASYASILSAPVIFGFLAEKWGTGLFTYFLAAAFAITAISTFAMKKSAKNKT